MKAIGYLGLFAMIAACGGDRGAAADAQVPPPASTSTATAAGPATAPAPPPEATPAPTATAQPTASSAPASPDPPPSVAAPPTPCEEVQRIIDNGNVKANEVTVLTPNPDETIAEIMDGTAASLGALTLEDKKLKEHVEAYRKALQRRAAATRELDVFMKKSTNSGARFDQKKSDAIGKRLQEAERARATAGKSLATYCREGNAGS